VEITRSKLAGGGDSRFSRFCPLGYGPGAMRSLYHIIPEKMILQFWMCHLHGVVEW